MHNVVIFVHIPKCGGTTFSGILKALYGDALILHPEAHGWPADLSSYQAIASHFRYGLHERFGRPGTYLSLLRDPLDNVVSFYNAVTSRPDHILHTETKGMAVEQFVSYLDGRNHPVLRNRQCLHICNEGNYDLAREYVEQRYAAVAPLEWFDEFVSRVCGLLDKRVPAYERKNISTRTVAPDDLPLPLKRRIYTCNSADLRLYHFVRERFFLTPA